MYHPGAIFQTPAPPFLSIIYINSITVAYRYADTMYIDYNLAIIKAVA